ncbi:MAG: hypothetical protein KC550_02545, partial [Nanoarchaeota archaeon]|nr:hypothetical protein [Nanoarchaeota archaeon]
MVKFRKSLGFIAGILMFVVLVFVSITWADSNGVWNRAEDMRPGIIGGDENSGDFTFNSSLFVLNGNVAIGTNVSNGKFRVVDTYSGSVFSQVLIKGGSYGFQEIYSDGLSDDGNVPYLSFHRGNQIGWQQGLVGNNFVIAWGSGANTDNMFANRIFTITNDSKVGIRTVNPRYGLDVSGQMISSGIGSQYIMQETDNPINVNDLWHMSYNS